MTTFINPRAGVATAALLLLAACSLPLVNQTAASVVVAPKEVTVAVKATVALSATLKTLDGQIAKNSTNQPLQPIWTSSNTAVATVNANGVVTGIKEGKATITATSSSITDISSITVVP